MFTKTKQLLLAISAFFMLGACGPIHEDLARCEVYLEFVFDYNMEYVNSFGTHINAVDVYVFDQAGKFLFTRRASSNELIDGNRMALTDDLQPGKYKVLTVGALCENFLLSDGTGRLRPGETTLEDVTLALVYESNTVAHNFPHVWFGKVVEIDYGANVGENKVWRVDFIRNTNKFNFVLRDMDAIRSIGDASERTVPYTFEVVTPESAVYSWEDEPVGMGQSVTYIPYLLTPGVSVDELSVGHLNTCRLFDRDNCSYRIQIRRTDTSELVWDYNLLTLLEHTKPAHPDGSQIPLQEYLDRQGQWNIAILYREKNPGDPTAFVVVGVEVNSWILWLNDIGI